MKGFWFFQKPISVNPEGTFSGVHSDVAIFILSAFTESGGTSTIRVLKWVGNNALTECLPLRPSIPRAALPTSQRAAFAISLRFLQVEQALVAGLERRGDDNELALHQKGWNSPLVLEYRSLS